MRINFFAPNFEILRGTMRRRSCGRKFLVIVALITTATAIANAVKVKRSVGQSNGNNRVIERREIILTASGEHGCRDWSGKRETTCDTFTSIEDLSNSGCAATNEYSHVIQHGLNGSLSDGGVWCPCGSQPCSMIFRVDNATARVAQLVVSAWVDRKAEILVLAEFMVEQGEFFQIGKLHSKRHDDSELQRVEFEYVREEYLDMSEVNVTMVRNGGLALLDTFIIVLEESKETTTTPATPPADLVILDTRDDESKREWLQVDCHYSDYYEDFWTFGCPVKSDSNYLPSSMGFWYPCRDKTCGFVYDGTNDGEPLYVTLQGYFHGGEVTLSGKHDILEEIHWRPLETRSFHGSTETSVQFNLQDVCNVKVLLITINADTDNVILVDSIHVKVQPQNTSKECHPTVDTQAKEMEFNSASPQFKYAATFAKTVTLLLCTLSSHFSWTL